MPGNVYIPKFCPRCKERLQRIHRRPLDRLISLFYPVQRYRCPSPQCCWEGNVRVRRN